MERDAGGEPPDAAPEHGVRRVPEGRHRRDWRRISALVLVPVIMAITDVAATRSALKFLLLPPLGALTYLVFVNPAQVDMNARRIIVSPTLTAVWAWGLANAVGYNALSVVLATVGTMAIMWGLDAPAVVPPMALALLTILLHQEVKGRPDYILSVLVFTLVLYALYRLWLRIPFQRLS